MSDRGCAGPAVLFLDVRFANTSRYMLRRCGRFFACRSFLCEMWDCSIAFKNASDGVWSQTERIYLRRRLIFSSRGYRDLGFLSFSVPCCCAACSCGSDLDGVNSTAIKFVAIEDVESQNNGGAGVLSIESNGGGCERFL